MKRLECLDGLRGLLALYVLLGHMAPFAALPAWLQSAVSHGGAAVAVFFTLSGLVVTRSLEHAGGRTAPFVIARVARIFPVYLPVFACAVLIQPVSCGFEQMPWLRWNNPAHSICVSGWPRQAAAEIAAHLTMTHGLLPHAVLPDVWVSFLGSAWSLSTEWQFYLLALLARRRERLLELLLAMAFAAAAWRLAGPPEWQFSRAFLPNQAHFFALGVASIGVVLDEPGAMRRLAVTSAATVLLCATAGAAGKLLPPLVWLVCLAAQIGAAGPVPAMIRRGLGSRVCLFLGTISYCLYLVNEPIHKLASRWLAGVAQGDSLVFTALWVPVAIGLPVAVSIGMHLWLEKPALRWGRRMAAELLYTPGWRIGQA
jgi:peptidoglycan/LPS O-acetylase OafA/YrhL